MQATRPVGAGLAVDGRAVLRGVAVGLAVVVPVTIARAVVERHVNDLSSSAWIYPLSALVLLAYAAAGAVAARTARGAPLVSAGLAGAGVVVAWLPVRVLIWAVRETGRGLVSGDRAALPPADVVGALALAAVLAGLAGWVARRVGSRGVAPGG